MPQAASQFSGIFICYRREESGGHAGRLFDRLTAHFGEDQVFMDIDHIEPGADFVKVIEEAVGSCEVLVALIGRSWLTSHDDIGRRLENPNDFVRLEIVAALSRDVPVIPVLVQDARMPRPHELPEDLSPLSRRHAFELSDLRWKRDVDQLIDALVRVLERRRGARLKAEQEEEAERRRLEAEARRQEEESERLKQATAEAERQKREAEEAERRRRESEEREHRAADQAASAIPLITEPTKGSLAAHNPSTVKTLPASAHTTPDYREQKVATVAMPRRAGMSRRAMLIIIIACGVVLAVMWFLIRRPAAGTGAAAKQNPAPVGIPQTGQTNTPPSATEMTQPPPGMVYVPGGAFTMGRDEKDGGDEYERPAHTETVKPFFIDIYEVTREDYKKCVDEKQCPQPRGWTRGAFPKGTARKPVTGVDWDAANAYAKWRSNRDNATYRLPTEDEWEFAARGADGRLYPWGNDWHAGLANADHASGDMADVGTYKGASPFGAFDMVGNAWEWTKSNLTAYPGGSLPVKVSDDLKVIRGGSFESDRNRATTTYRRGWSASAEGDYSRTGFRCVKDIGGS